MSDLVGNQNVGFLMTLLIYFSASVHLELQEFQNTELVDKWYSFVPSATFRGSGEVGALRLKTRYIHQVIMPEEQYTSLKDVSLFLNKPSRKACS